MGGIDLIADRCSIAEVPLHAAVVAAQIRGECDFLPYSDLTAVEVEGCPYRDIDLDVHLLDRHRTAADTAGDECHRIRPRLLEDVHRRFAVRKGTIIEIPGVGFDRSAGLVSEQQRLTRQWLRVLTGEPRLYRAAESDLEFFSRLVSGFFVAYDQRNGVRAWFREYMGGVRRVDLSSAIVEVPRIGADCAL